MYNKKLNCEGIGVVFCANCGAPNHIYKNCNHPIMSFGVVCVRLSNGLEPQYLMVQRKDSLSYGTFLRGKFRIENRKYILELFENMTKTERCNIETWGFEALWKALWQITECNTYMREFEDAKQKFETLRAGYVTKADDGQDMLFNIDYILANTVPLYNETEWGFPKGRRNINEDDLPCAFREFTEETSIPHDQIAVLFSKPCEEVFTGGNRLRYKHVYYICLLMGEQFKTCKKIQPDTELQKREINSVEWFRYDDAQANIREFNAERKELFKCIHDTVLTFSHTSV